MSVLFRSPTIIEGPSRFPVRTNKTVGSTLVTDDSALFHSAVWASLRLRADLISAMPIDAYRKVNGIDIEVPKSPILLNPGGDEWDTGTWLWATQFDLDRVGNCFGIITEKDGDGNPAVIQLADHKNVAVNVRKDVVTYRIKNVAYDAASIWHERQYRLPGQVMGLSALSLAAYSIGMYLSAQEFGIEWFNNGGTVPSGHLRNGAKKLDAGQADQIKEQFKLAISDRDVFVTGEDWTYSTIQVAANEGQFLASQDWSSGDVARFIGVPGDLIDLAVKGSAVTYANITQRNLQFLIMNLWPAVRRRQTALSRLVADPRYVRFNTDALLQMDPQTKSLVHGQQVRDRIRVASEVRGNDNLEPYTDAQWAEMERLFPKGSTPGKSTTIGD
ncbi:MAG: phage portal protein [Rhodoglobus sp.]